MNVSPILPNVLQDHSGALAFHDGVEAGYHDCTLDLALLHLGNTVEEPETHIDKFATAYPGEHSSDWYAGWLAGYNLRRKYVGASYGRSENHSGDATGGLPDQGKMPTAQ